MVAGSVIVVGGGVFGVTAALELRKRGYRVTLIDPGPLPHPLASSTDISKVIRMDYGTDAFYMQLMEEALRGWERWNRSWDEPLYHPTGVLLLSRTQMEPGGFEYESFKLLEQRSHHPQRLDSEALRRRFPAWNANRYPDGYYNPLGGWAESGKVIAALLKYALQIGVEWVSGARFAALLENDARITGIRTVEGERFHADHVIVAAGAWTPHLLPHLSEFMWSVGQDVVHFKVPDPSSFQPPRFVPWTADVARTGWYGFPAKDDGTLKIAHHGVGIRLHPEAPRRVSPDAEDRVRELIRSAIPALADIPMVDSRLCLYCDTWDGNFYIDHDPERPGLLIATGGSGHGFKFAPVLGQIAADALERKPNPYAGKFAWRDRGQLTTEEARFHND